ncbi:MAG: hypothetical protein WDZ88_03255 [Candidatus Paceibacterota bacterium]
MKKIASLLLVLLSVTTLTYAQTTTVEIVFADQHNLDVFSFSTQNASSGVVSTSGQTGSASLRIIAEAPNGEVSWAQKDAITGVNTITLKVMSFLIDDLHNTSITVSTQEGSEVYSLSEYLPDDLESLSWHDVEIPLSESDTSGITRIAITSSKATRQMWFDEIKLKHISGPEPEIILEEIRHLIDSEGNREVSLSVRGTPNTYFAVLSSNTLPAIEWVRLDRNFTIPPSGHIELPLIPVNQDNTFFITQSIPAIE